MAVEVTLAPMSERPSVSVVVPFAGSADALERLLEALTQVARGAGDELIVADNRRSGAPPPTAAASSADVIVIPAHGVRTPAFARNRGAALARGEWLVFIDADTRPSPTLLDSYFDPPPGEATAVLAGGIEDLPAGPGLAARHSSGRSHMSELTALARTGRAYAQTANCAVRTSAFSAVGGFEERARAGEDADLCFRLELAGWAIEHRPQARVGHLTRATLPSLLAQLARHGSGAAWLDRRYPGEFPAPRPRELAARFAHDGATALSALRHRRREQAALAGLEIVCGCAFEAGRLLPNRGRF
jgi:GT2 family glycosyltransferase